MPKTRYLSGKLLEHQVGTPYTAPTLFMGLSSTYPSTVGGNVTEPSTGGYARITCSGKWGTVTLGDPSSVTNNTEIALPESTGSWLAGAELLAVGLWDAVSGGNLLHFDWLGRTIAGDKYGIPQNINTTSDVISIASHGFTSGESAVVQPLDGTILANGLTADIRYWVEAIDTNSLKLHTNSTLTAAVDLTSQGSGGFRIFKIIPRNVNAAGVVLRFQSGTLSLRER